MHLMIDLETLGTAPNSPILSLGAVLFDKTGVKSTYYLVFNLDEQLNNGRIPSASTIKWWMSQSASSQEVFENDGDPCSEKILDFVNWLEEEVSDLGTMRVWGNGSSFDVTILEHMMDQYNLTPPWKFWNIRDFRTFREFVYDNPGIERVGTYHNALDDATTQANLIIEYLQKTK